MCRPSAQACRTVSGVAVQGRKGREGGKPASPPTEPETNPGTSVQPVRHGVSTTKVPLEKLNKHTADNDTLAPNALSSAESGLATAPDAKPTLPAPRHAQKRERPESGHQACSEEIGRPSVHRCSPGMKSENHRPPHHERRSPARGVESAIARTWWNTGANEWKRTKRNGRSPHSQRSSRR